MEIRDPRGYTLKEVRAKTEKERRQAAAQIKVLMSQSQRGLEKLRRALTTVQLRTSLDILVPLREL